MNLHWDDLYKEVQHLDMPFGRMVILCFWVGCWMFVGKTEKLWKTERNSGIPQLEA